jgi:hypothetical protein
MLAALIPVAYSFSAPRATSASSANSAMVNATNTTSPTTIGLLVGIPGPEVDPPDRLRSCRRLTQ